MHNSVSSAKTSLHTFARISFYNFHSFKEKSPHDGDSGQLSAFPQSAVCQSKPHSPAQSGSLYLLALRDPRGLRATEENARSQRRLDSLRRNILGEEAIIES